jgi:hypothetical protein
MLAVEQMVQQGSVPCRTGKSAPGSLSAGRIAERCRVVRRLWFATLPVLAGLAFGGGSACAADLRVDHAELARLVNTFASQAKITLNNVPGGFFGIGATTSSISVAGTTVPVPIPVRSLDVAGARLVYYVNDINSARITATARPGAVRLSVAFEEAGPELVGDCISAYCPLDAVLPNIEWAGAVVHVDLVPARANGSVSLAAKSVQIAGRLEPVCQSNAGLISGFICRATLAKARAAIAKVRGDLEVGLRDQLNGEQMQKGIGASLKKYLSIGAAGEVEISSIAVDTKGVLVSFRFASQ